MEVLLLATYEMGRQSFGLGVAAAALKERGFPVTMQDLSLDPLDAEAVRRARLVAVHVPMHTATRLALRVLARVRSLNPRASLCCFGLYAPGNEGVLRRAGADVVLGGEAEEALAAAAERLRRRGPGPQEEPVVSLARQRLPVPHREGLPPLSRYAKLVEAGGRERLAGATEASRGCKHLCRHCPVVPVYRGAFRVVDREVVLEDIRRQAEAGATHITFGDPDFLNGPSHARRIVEQIPRRFPGLTYDVTAKVEHLLRHASMLPLLRETGCAFVTTAVESVDDRILALLDKGHTRDDVARLVARCHRVGLPLSPTFVPFTPWTTREGYLDLLETLRVLGLAPAVAPVQLSVRLLIPAGSRLLELAELAPHLEAFDAEGLSWRWTHPDPAMDALQKAVEEEAGEGARTGRPRPEVFARIETLSRGAAGLPAPIRAVGGAEDGAREPAVPYLSEPWFC